MAYYDHIYVLQFVGLVKKYTLSLYCSHPISLLYVADFLFLFVFFLLGILQWVVLSSLPQRAVPTHWVAVERCGLASTNLSGLLFGK